MKRQFQVFNFAIQNASSDAVDIHIDGDIVDAETQQILRDWYGDDTSVSFKSFRDQLNKVDAQTYNVYINSGGGLVTDAMAIHDLLIDLQAKGKKVNTIGRGIIASAATYILMAGASAEMSENSWFMIHNVSGVVWGDVNMVESYAATLRKFNNAARDFYAKATGIRKEEITKMMDAETWMTAEEAKNKGFIQKVSGKANFTNSIKPEHWQFSNTAVLNAYNSFVGDPPAESQFTFIQNQLNDMKKFFQNISNALKSVKPAENGDQAALVNQIAEAITGPLEQVGDEIETTITNQVDAAIASEATTNAINTAVQTAVADLTNRVAALETTNADLAKRNDDLETEITNLKGKPTIQQTSDGPAPIGGFK